MKSRRILIINPFGIGDVIFSTPLIEAIRKEYPDCFIGYVCNKRSYEVMKSNPRIDKLFVYEKDDYRAAWEKSKLKYAGMISKSLNGIRKERFDTAIDLSLSYQYSLLLKLIRIRNRVGFNYRNRGRFLTRKIEIEGFSDKHVIEYYYDMLKLLDLDPTHPIPCPRVYLGEGDVEWADNFLKDNCAGKDDLVIGVIPGCGASWGADASHRRWGCEGFAGVCDGLVERYGAKIILLGDRNEVNICEEVQRRSRHKLMMACGKTTLRNFLGLVKRCRLIITNDGGPLHMAVGLGVRTISIFGPVDDKVYGPYPLTNSHVVVCRRDLPCRPCYKKFKHDMCGDRKCLSGIGPEDILKAAERLLSK